jgi:hypothetical protein
MPDSARIVPQGSFPLAALPPSRWSWRTGQRAFGANRSGGRAHAGSDLYCPVGTTVYAVCDGVVLRGPYEFYARTYALEIDHGSFVFRYGEIQQGAMVRAGDHVSRGQPIAHVAKLVGIVVPSAMLHGEAYSKTATGPLTTSAGAGARHTNGRPFYRRRDLVNSGPWLDEWAENLPGARPVLREGSRGPDVAGLQAALAALGYGPFVPAGLFGPVTRAAVVAYQARKGLDQDGVVGGDVWAAIERDGL